MKRLAVVVVAVTAALVGTAGPALAAWNHMWTASARAEALSVPAGLVPAGSPSGSSVTVTFPQVSVNGTALGALAGGGYRVDRYRPNGTLETVAGTCAALVTGPAATLSCTDTGVPKGPWRYRVTPVLGAWVGAESGDSGNVQVP